MQCNEIDLFVVWVIEDHPLYRDALAALLQAKLAVQVLTFDAVSTALADPQAAQPSLILIDFNLQGQDTGTRALSLLREHFPAVKLVSHSAEEDLHVVQAAVRAGAQAFISKGIAPDNLATELEQLLHQSIEAPFWIQAYGRQTLSELAAPQFTGRQYEIVQLMQQGKSNKHIAIELNVAEITVKQHLSKIFEKLAVHTRTQAIAKLHGRDPR